MHGEGSRSAEGGASHRPRHSDSGHRGALRGTMGWGWPIAKPAPAPRVPRVGTLATAVISEANQW